MCGGALRPALRYGRGMKIIEGEFRVIGEEPVPRRRSRQVASALIEVRGLLFHRTVWLLAAWISLCFWIAHQP